MRELAPPIGEQAKQSGKPEAVIPKIVAGQLAKWSKEICPGP